MLHVAHVNPFAPLTMALLLIPAPAMAQFMTLDFPGATATFANDINDSGEIVGTYYLLNGDSRGFLYDGSNYTTIHYPNADWSEATGINQQGDIVGFYGYNTENFFHGFLRTATIGTFTSIDRGGRWNTMPQDINMSGAIAGCVHNHGAMFGWVLQGGAFTAETSGESWTGYAMYTSVTDGGTLVGWYWSANFIRSFVLVGTGRTDFQFPGTGNTQAWDVNSLGDIVGWYGPGAASRGFLRRNGEFTHIHVPNATWTRAFGINANGDIAGAYRDGTGTHGFLLPAQ
jgi:hypothetical protein